MNRIPINQLYNLLNCKKDKYFFDNNIKEIRYIQNVIIKTIDKFSSTIKPKFDFEVKLDLEKKLSFRKKLFLINNFIKNNLNYDELLSLDIEDYISYKHNRFSDSGIIGFIDYYLKLYLLLSIILCTGKLKFTKTTYYSKTLHNFDIFNDEKLNINFNMLLHHLLYEHKFEPSIAINILDEFNKDELSLNFLKIYTKKIFEYIYKTYNLIGNVKTFKYIKSKTEIFIEFIIRSLIE